SRANVFCRRQMISDAVIVDYYSRETGPHHRGMQLLVVFTCGCAFQLDPYVEACHSRSYLPPFFLSGACVSTDAASFFESAIVGVFASESTHDARVAIFGELFSFLAMAHSSW